MIVGDLDRGGGDQPHPLALRRGASGPARGCPARSGRAIASSKISSPSSSSSATGVPGDERQGRACAPRRRARGSRRRRSGSRPASRRPRQVSRGEELAAVQPAGEVEDAGALHHRVVDVEERGRGRVEFGGSGSGGGSGVRMCRGVLGRRPRRRRPPGRDARGCSCRGAAAVLRRSPPWQSLYRRAASRHRSRRVPVMTDRWTAGDRRTVDRPAARVRLG